MPNKALQLIPSRIAPLFTTILPLFAIRYRMPARARGSWGKGQENILVSLSNRFSGRV